MPFEQLMLGHKDVSGLYLRLESRGPWRESCSDR
jgi:hypothetical protein